MDMEVPVIVKLS